MSDVKTVFAEEVSIAPLPAQSLYRNNIDLLATSKLLLVSWANLLGNETIIELSTIILFVSELLQQMADTAMGLPGSQDPNSEFNAFDWGFNDQFLVTEPDTFNAGNLSQFQPQSFDMYNPEIQPTLHGGHGRSFSGRSLSSPHVMQRQHLRNPSRKDRADMNGLAHGETRQPGSSSPAVPKRKALADKLLLKGVSSLLPVILMPFEANSWQQKMRRQKPKSHQSHSRPNTEGPSGSSTKASSSSMLSVLPSETLPSSDRVYGYQSSSEVSASSYSLDVDPSSIFNQTMLSHDAQIPHPSDPDFGGMRADYQLNQHYHEHQNQSNAMHSLDSMTMVEALAEPVNSSKGKPFTHTSGLAGSRSMPTGFYGSGPTITDPNGMQQTLLSSSLLRNTSTQTLASSVSSLGDPNSLISPPSQTPSMPWLNSEFEHRRVSDSSELAHNVEGMHLQGPPGLTLATNMGPSPHSSAISINGVATPDTSPEQFSSQPFVPQTDLASRRKRVRPTLRPEGSRNVSQNDSLNGSPHSRTSSLSVGAPAGPRRVQSGQALHNNQFRIHKPGSNAAQVSPRNLQTHFERNALPQPSKRSTSNSANASPTTPHDPPSKPSASAASANRSPAEYQHEFHVRSASTSHGAHGQFHMPRHANASVPNLHSSSPAPQMPYPIQIPGQHGGQLAGTHGPLSAPPHQTNFFGDSPPTQGPFAPPASQNSGFGPPGSQELAYGNLPIQQSGQYPPQNFLPPFAPHYTFPEASGMGNFGPTGYLPSFPPGVVTVPSPPNVELDIKVEVGPQPSLSRPFERCEFQHTFSNKWRQTGDKK